MDRTLLFGCQTANPNTSPASGNPATMVAVTSRGVLRVDLSAGGIAIPGQANDSDNVAPVATLQNLPVISYNYLFDGTNYDRMRSASAANLATFNGTGAQLIAPVGNWSQFHSPALGAQATTSRAAVAGQRHVCTSMYARLTDSVTVPIANAIAVNLRDGASGAGTILWSTRLIVFSGTANPPQYGSVILTGLNIVGSVNTAMTLEFAAAGAGTSIEDVAMTGFTAA